ncbi:CDP-alcohol phosphatidyltransferase family protein [Stenotrophomonas sp. ATCM1_4]|jgi:phosphatidylglycerophosphate synthase|uniref:CDP-alcohol phosphatidyltransferase family protein n=1 Tax=Stenotrophomonas capsici TaxID=3110230 RepID=A0ABU5UYZ9_9GAMM|nr:MULTISPECIES: CDP-alcohol phosphatidyltransferase family protein [unclassified Stenotrophomonas]MEA5666318.1 CDP-alcohol phosphatidyltransferase family protein [Stenotrophomonas sp. MH1]TDB28142.1 CDP-alcohol phosphatidyltransferase family protein [Stenotrophomonas sp. ATCM1_4]
MGKEDRRPIAARSTGWAQALSAALARSSVTPNQISVLSIFFAVIGAVGLLAAPSLLGLVACIIGVQLRLVCNLLDGMVAMEGGKQTPTGALYNEYPDRIADSLLIVALGYAAGMPWLGWLGALLAALTAYVRLSGASLGLPQDFRGPMAKQHRMFVLTLACVAAIIEQWVSHTGYALQVAAVVIAAGALLTCITRTRAIAAQLKARS